MAQYHLHKIGSVSPLVPNLKRAYRILATIQEKKPESIYPIRVPSIEQFEPEKVYESELIQDVVTLAHYSRPVPHEIIERAWECLFKLSLELFEINGFLGEDGKIAWPSVYVHGESKFSDGSEVHCETCTQALRTYYARVRQNTPSASDFDSLAHGDVHAGNLIYVAPSFLAIDLENIHSAPAFADLFLFSLLVEGAAPHLNEMLQRFSAAINRAPNYDVDLRHALSIMLVQYFRAAGSTKTSVGWAVHHTLAALSDGLNNQTVG